MENKKDSIALLSYASGLGARLSGCGQGPIQLRTSPYIDKLQHCLEWDTALEPQEFNQGLAALNSIADLSQKLAMAAARLIRKQQFFITLGGDHTCAIGTWSGVAGALDPQSLGLIWIDAHLDSHTPQTTHSGNIHGMPAAILLGYGPPELTQVFSHKHKLRPENMCFIGIRSYEPEEQHFLEKMNVRIFYMAEIQKRGITAVFEEAISHVKKNSDFLGVSLDLDAISPEFAPGVGSPEPNGIDPNSLYQGMALILKQKELIAAEIAEYNPSLDQGFKTEQIIASIIAQIVQNQTKCKE
jgi:arginase